MKFYGNAQFLQNFGWLTQISAETSVSIKFPHQEIRWNYGTLYSILLVMLCKEHSENNLETERGDTLELVYVMSKNKISAKVFCPELFEYLVT